MRYIIVEDELPAQELLRQLIAKLRPDWELDICLDSVEEAVSWLRGNPHPDVAFFDIQLSDGLSFEVLEQVDIQSMLVFTTAYDEYAIRAFKVNSIDYLLKPIKESELSQAIAKYEDYTNKRFSSHNSAIDTAGILEAIRQSKVNYRSRFLVTYGDTFVPLPVQSVAYMFTRNKLTYAVTFDGEQHFLDFSLDKLESQLDPDLFFRASRQFIVHVKAVRKVHSYFNGKLVLETHPPHQEKINISRQKARAFRDWLDK